LHNEKTVGFSVMGLIKIRLPESGVMQLFVFVTISFFLLMPSLYLLWIDALSFNDIALKTAVFPLTVWIVQRLLSLVACKSLTLSTVLAIVFLILFFVATWIEAGLIHFTGKEFSPDFFYHVNWESSIIVLHTYKWFLLFMLISIIISSLILQKQLKSQKSSRDSIRRRSVIYALLFIFLCLPNTAVWGVCKGAWEYYFTHKIEIQPTSHDKKVLSDIGIRLITQKRSDIRASLPDLPENLIVIFLESMNFQFVNNADFPGLTPFLNSYSNRFTLLGNHISTENATLPAMISNLCGIIPDYSMGNDTFFLEESIYKDLPCFTDILHTAGYYQVYMGGAKSSFAGKGDFLSQHGYDEIIGWEQLQNLERYEDDESHSYWGLYDSDLFEEAISKVESLKERSPFNLTLLTLNTHLPGISSKSCPGYKEESKNEMLDAIHCSDAAVGRFLDWLDKKGFFENSTIVIVGDHKMFNHENTRAILGKKMADQRIFGLIHSPGDLLPAVVDGRTAPYDMASTIPELLGVHHNISFSIGQSLLKPITDNRFILDRDHQNSAHGCDPMKISLPMNPPFSSCDHRRIISIMDHNLSSFTQHESSIIEKLELVMMRASKQEGGKPSIFLDNMEQLDHISQDGMWRDPTASGIYCVILSSDGKVKQRNFYDVSDPSDMGDFIGLLTNLGWGDWFFMTHKGDVMGRIPSSAHYLLEKMGWKMPLSLLNGSDCIFVTRMGIDPEAAFFRYSNSSEELEVELGFSDLEDLLLLPSPPETREDIFNTPELLSMMVDDGYAIGMNMESGIKICGFGGGDSSVSFFLEHVNLQRGVNILLFSRAHKLLATLNYDFHDPDVNVDELLEVLSADTSKLDITVVVAVHDDAKTYMPSTVTQAFKNMGAEKIDDLEIRSPYLLVFHTKYGIIYEAVGKSGECIIQGSGKIIKKVLSFAEKQNDK